MSFRRVKNLDKSKPSKKLRLTASLHNAIRNGEKEFLEKLFQYDYVHNIEAIDKSGLKPLHVAILCKNEDIAKLLIDNGANVNAKSKEKQTLPEIRNAIETYGMNAQIEYYYIKECTNLTPLQIAIVNKLVNLVEILIQKGANVNAETFYGFRPIHFAVYSGCSEIVYFLFKNGAKVDCDNNLPNDYVSQDDLIKYAAMQGNVKVLKILFQQCTYVDTTLALHNAIEGGHIEVVEEIIVNWDGPDPYLVDSYHCEFTPLRLAMQCDRLDMIRLLINHGADIELPSEATLSMEYMRTPLEIACMILRDVEMAECLILKGANMEVLEFDLPEKSTLLHQAINEEVTDIAEMLIYFGANLNVKNNANKTPLHCAMEQESGCIIQALIQNGADQEIQDKTEDGTECNKPLETALDLKKIISIKTFLHANL